MVKFLCDYGDCKRIFLSAEYLAAHIRTHSGLKPFVCEVCSRTFSLMSNLKAHFQVHDKTRRFGCPVDNCRKVFKRSARLKQHLIERHQVNGQSSSSDESSNSEAIDLDLSSPLTSSPSSSSLFSSPSSSPSSSSPPAFSGYSKSSSPNLFSFPSNSDSRSCLSSTNEAIVPSSQVPLFSSTCNYSASPTMTKPTNYFTKTKGGTVMSSTLLKPELYGYFFNQPLTNTKFPIITKPVVIRQQTGIQPCNSSNSLIVENSLSTFTRTTSNSNEHHLTTSPPFDPPYSSLSQASSSSCPSLPNAAQWRLQEGPISCETVVKRIRISDLLN